MTQIDNINESGSSFGQKTPKVGKGDKTDAFHNALSQALNTKKSAGAQSTSSSQLQEISSVGPTMMSHTDIVSGKTDKLLGLLEAYTSKLGDPSVSLKSMAPDLEKIKTSAGSLEQDARALGKEASSLKEIANQTVMTAQTEYLKFQRGDYTS